MGPKLEPIQFEIRSTEGKKAELDALNKDKKEEEVPQVDKDRLKEYEEQIRNMRQQRDQLLTTYGENQQVVGQLIDLALLANGLLKGEALNRFVKRSVDLIEK